MSKCKVMGEKLLEIEGIRELAIEWENGTPMRHSGQASKILKLKLPMTVDVARSLFALLSIDDTLPKRKRKRTDNVEEVEEGEGEDEEREEIEGIAEVAPSISIPSLLTPNALEANSAALSSTEVLAAVDPSKDLVTASAQTYQNYKSALKW